MNVSKSEYVLLSILWSEQPLTVGQLIERAQLEEDWHENTIKTMLIRLAKKGALERYKDGKRYFYRPLLDKNDALLEESEGFLSQFFEGKMAPLVAHFAKNKKLKPQDIDDIQRILDKLKND